MTKLTCSVGIAPDMMIAKVCSDMNKPNGQYQVASSRQAVVDFMDKLPVRKVPGVGKVSLPSLSLCSCCLIAPVTRSLVCSCVVGHRCALII
jgi:DNA polymerase kappa